MLSAEDGLCCVVILARFVGEGVCEGDLRLLSYCVDEEVLAKEVFRLVRRVFEEEVDFRR